MIPYPHIYIASSESADTGIVAVGSPQLPSLQTAAPPEFGGPHGVWSPEALLCASVADCFTLTFRAVARAARCEWVELHCRVEGELDRVERVSQFTRFTLFAKLSVPAGTDEVKARELLEAAERACLVSNSLRAPRALETEVVVTSPALSAV